MGVALIGTHAFKQNLTGGAFEALAAGSGDSLVIPSFVDGSHASILEAWGANSAHVCDFGVRSPSFHDNTRGIRMAYDVKPAAGDPEFLLPWTVKQPLYKTDTLTAEVNGTAADNAALELLAYYENLDGASQRLTSWADAQNRGVNMVGIFVNPTAGAAGDWGTARAINADDDRLIAGKDYALLGITVQTRCASIAITGPSTSNRKITMPGHPDAAKMADWFVQLSNKYGLPLIPIINANDKGNITVQAADPNGATVPHVVLNLMQLA